MVPLHCRKNSGFLKTSHLKMHLLLYATSAAVKCGVQPIFQGKINIEFNTDYVHTELIL